MKNYIEIRHEFDEMNEEYHTKCIDVWHAVQPPAGACVMTNLKTGNRVGGEESVGQYWRIQGSNDIVIYEQSDIDGLRKLLDAIEEELNNKEEK